MPEFRYRSTLPFPPDEVFAWHERPGAFERLTPPWAEVRVLERTGTIRDGDGVTLELEKGPLHLTWKLRHKGFEEGRRFVDEQVEGPFESWEHVHGFEPAEDGGCVMVDVVRWKGPLGPAGQLGDPVVERELSRLFPFRHRRLLHDLTLHARHRDAGRKTFAITGSSGLIGTALRHFLTTGGHDVLRIVRSRDEAAAPDAVFWDVQKQEFDGALLRGVDAVIHLAGEPLVQLPRWNAEKKRRILESRVKGTELIARTLAGLHDGARALVSASAVGYYGGRGDEVLTEDSRPGTGFLSEVCQAWEAATRRAEGAGVRVVRSRNGIALSPTGGMLKQILVPFKMGVGGRIGSGKQYVPWIDLDDMVGLLHHAALDGSVQGAMNAVAPDPVPNATFVDILARVVHRPSLVPVPAFAVKAALGEMGEETILKGQRARPARARDAGYRFLLEGLEDSLRFQLGRVEA